jgi:IS1 family transposase
VGRKAKKVYVWTARAERADGSVERFVYVSPFKDIRGLTGFLLELPRAHFYFSDGNPAYGTLMAQQKKGAQTNRVESFNSQLRQYVGFLRRKTKAYAKRLDHLQLDLYLITNGLNQK